MHAIAFPPAECRVLTELRLSDEIPSILRFVVNAGHTTGEIMYGSRSERTPLFFEGDGHAAMSAQLQKAVAEASSLPEQRILGTDPAALLEYFAEKYVVIIPTINRDAIVAEHHERTIIVYNRFDQREHQVPGEAYDFEIPFTGEPLIFKLRPSTFDSGPPYAQVAGSVLRFSISGRTLVAEEVKRELDSLLADVERYLGWHRVLWQNLEGSIRRDVGQAIQNRRDLLMRQKGSVAQLAGLGIKLREKPGDARTYVPPAVKQKLVPQLPPMRAASPPDPALDRSQYETILGLLRGAGRSIEQSSSRTRQLDEEALRDMFLVPLNAHFGTAAGEAFNFTGKTDVTVKHEGGNLFVAEFKIWGGEKLFLETIDQLLGYLTWRDTKTAVVMFNRNVGFSEVVAKMRAAVKSHARFVSGPTRLDETSDQYTFKLLQDSDRMVTLSVLAFDLGPAS